MTPRQLQYIAMVVSVAAIFVADCSTERAVAIPLLYIGPVWLAYSVRHERWIWITTASVSILTVAGHFIIHGDGDGDAWASLTARSLALFGIWLTAVQCAWIRQLQGMQLRANDILEYRVAERTSQLRAIEERFELAVRGSTDGLWDWNVVTNEIYYSPRIKELLGYRDDELPNLFSIFESHLHPDDHGWVMREIDEHLRLHKPYDVEYRLACKSGEYHWFRARGQAIWNAAGQALRMAGSITDVTEQHRLRERFRLAVEASPAALMMVHQDGHILMANSRSLSLFGYSEAEMIGQPIEMLVPERFREIHPTHRQQFFQAPTQRAMGGDLDLVGLRKDGTEVPVKVGLSPVQTAEGPAVICGIMDITDQMTSLEAMRHAKEAAESSSLAKSSFLANMSHEIRTPMNGIIGMSQLLSQTSLLSHQRDYLTTIEESAHILLRLLNDILDFSKIEAGKLELESVDFRIAECVARSSQMLVLRAAEKGLEVACRVSPDIPDHLRGDPGRLQQVLVNLIGNAIKFTEAGEIFLNIDSEQISGNHIRLHFFVRDTGIGIPADKLDQIFRPFEQAESSTTRRFGGSGLGLTISRQLVEMMNGRLWVESEPGKGSTFHFTAEFGISVDQQSHEIAELASLKGMPVLVVDDNLTNRRILGEMLEFWQMSPVLADSANAARQALLQGIAIQQPIRLILLDHHMPGEDGLHFASSIREFQQHDNCPIILISSGSLPIDADLWQNRGVSRIMSKPVIASELLNEVLRQFGTLKTSRSSEPQAAATSSHVEPRRVLLVEDNEINRRVAVGLLRKRGHRVTVAENGLEAVNKSSEQEFDVILMDMQMPVMDGYAATTEIRTRERQIGGHIPIVAMTAEALKGDRDRCLSVGMDDYVAKPIAPAELYRAVERFPAICVRTDSGSEESFMKSASEPAAPVQSHASPAERNLLIDWEGAIQRLGGGATSLQEFADLLQSQIPVLLNDIRRGITSQDYKLLRRSAHTLKGSVMFFGAEPVVKLAQQLEMLGKNETLEGALETLSALESGIAEVNRELELGPPDSVV